MDIAIQLEQIWMELKGPATSCIIIHPNSHCLNEVIKKTAQVTKVSSKLYGVLYFIMFLLKFRNIYRERKVKKSLIEWSKDYLWSLAFMSWTVGGMKLALCFLNSIKAELNINAMAVLSMIASPSIFCLQKNKRSEVVLFTVVRSFRSVYIFLKKRYNFRFKSEKQFCFIMLYALLSLTFFEAPEHLRGKQILNSIWGQF